MTTISVGGDYRGAAGGLGDGYLKNFHNIGRLFEATKRLLNLRVASSRLTCHSARRASWNLSGWDIYDEANLGALNGMSPQNVSNAFAFSTPGQGVEISGGTRTAGITTHWQC